MSGCRAFAGRCPGQPATELRVTRDGKVGEWQPFCYQHADRFTVAAAAEGFGVEERPPALLREVLDHVDDPNVIPIGRVRSAA